MDLDLPWSDLARAAGGRLIHGSGQASVSSVSTDTRRIRGGEAFWALRGDRHDAHDFLDAGLARKASGWIVERGRLKPSGPRPARIVEVPDGLRALQALAAHHRRRFDIPVVGITGSNGKTTTKDMLRSILGRVGPTCASPGNWNNQVGVPLAVLELLPSHEYGVFELADSKPGDIQEVGRIAQPSLAVITNIGPDHLEFFGTLERNFQTKSELVDCLPADGRAVLNLDDPFLAALERRLGSRAVTFGREAQASVRISDEGDLLVDRHRIQPRLKAFGRLSLYNAAAAAAAAWALGIDHEAIRLGLEDYRPGGMRLEPRKGRGGCEIVLDAYNANPASMRAAIEAFCERFKGRPLVLALGDMKELGKASAGYHQELGRWLSELPLKALYLAGPEMTQAHEALRAASPGFSVRYGAHAGDWAAAFKEELSRPQAVLLKASRAMRFEDLLEDLEPQV